MTVERRRMSRNRILEGAIKILDEGVYGDLTVDALARALHMSKSTLYKYFASKDDVVVAVIDRACADTEAAVSAADLRTGSGDQALRLLTDIMADHADRIPRAAVLQAQRLPSACQDRLQLTHATLAQAVYDVIDHGTESGDFQFGEVALAASALVSSARAAMQASARGEVASARGVAVRTVMAMLTPGLKGAEASAA